MYVRKNIDELFEMEKLVAEHEHSHHGCGCGCGEAGRCDIMRVC